MNSAFRRVLNLVTAISLALPFGLMGGPAAVSLADPASPITVSNVDSPDPVASGAELTYTITIVNTGGAKIENLQLSDQVNGVGGIGVPPQLVLTSSQGSCSQSALKVTCLGGTLNGGASWTVTIRGVVTAANGTTINNTASVTGTKASQNFTSTGNAATLVTNGTGGPPLPDLTISKTGPSSVVTNSDYSYTLTVNNIGTQNATNVRVVDTLPAGVAYLGYATTSLFVCLPVGPAPAPVTVTCDGGAVNQGSNATITLNVTAPGSAGNITNTAVVDPDNTIPEINELNNTSATVSTSVTSAPAPQGLTIVKTDSPDPVNPGGILTYTVVVTNIASTRADDVVVVDGTQGLEASSITASQVIVNGAVGVNGGCTVVAPQVRCSIRSLNSGGTMTVTIKGTVLASAGSTIFNTATATANIKNQGVSATSSALTTVRPSVDLTITKADSPDPVCARSWPNPSGTPPHLPNSPFGLSPAGGTVPALLAAPVCLGGLTYNFVVGNSGTADATNVVVRDPLPAGLIFDSYSTDGGFVCAVDAANNVVTCTDGSVPAAQTRNISFLVVAPPNTGPITNTVTVDPNNAIFEADETNNTATQTTQVSTGIDLVVWKSDSVPANPPGDGAPTLIPGTAAALNDGYDPISTSGTETYTIYVDNVGTQDATGIRLRDTLPADAIFISVIALDPTHPADPTHGFTCSHDGSPTGGIVECVGGHLLGTASEFYDPAGPPPVGPGDDFATIKIRVFAQPTVGTMHNEVRVDPLNEIVEVNELNNLATDDTTVVAGNADKGAFNQLTITKTQVDPSPAAGDPNFTVAQNGTLIYNLEVKNLGTDPVSAIVVKDFLPTGSRFIEAKDTDTGPNIADAFLCVHDGSPTGGVITCTGGALSGSINEIPQNPGPGNVPTSRNITVKVFAPNTPGTYTNLAKVDPDNLIPEGNEFDNESQIDTTVTVGGNNMFNELTITKNQTTPASGTPVATSSTVVYTIVVGNSGSDPAFNVKVVDTLPAGFTYVEAKDLAPPGDQFAFNCSAAGQVVTCSGATINAGANRTITITALTSAVPGTYVNQALVDPDNTIPEGNETNNASQATTTVNVGAGNIDLQIGKTGPTQVTPGAEITYTLPVSNAGTQPAFNVKVRDDLPAGTTFISAADSLPGTAGAFTCSYVLGPGGSGGTVTCTNGTLDGSSNLAGDDVPTSRTIIVKVRAPTDIVPLSLSRGDVRIVVSNQAVIDPDNAIAESNETNNSSPLANTTVRSKINLKLTKAGNTSASQNTEFTYTIKVTNEDIDATGGATAFAVKVVDTLPVGLIVLNVTADPSNFLCSLQENPVNVVTCLGDLPTGSDVTISIKVFVTANGGTLDNEACVDPDGTITEQNELDNCKNVVTEIVPPSPDLLITKTASSGAMIPGATLTYTLQVTNVGSGPTTASMTVTDNLPSAVDFVSATDTSGSGFICAGTTTITCTGGAAGLMGPITTIDVVTKLKTTGLPASFTNTASVSVDPGGEPNTANNGPVSVTTGVATFDLQIVSISDSPDPVNTTEALTWTIVATYVGPTAVNGVAVKINLPPVGIMSVGAAGTNGFNCPSPVVGSEFTCTGDFLAGGGSTTITVTATVEVGAPSDLTLIATIDPAGVFPETNEANNSKTQTTTVSDFVCTATPCIDLVLTQLTGSPSPVNVGGVATFVFVVTNVGDTPTPANAAHIHFGVLDDFTGASIAVPAGWTCADLSNLAGDRSWFCDGTLVAGAGATFTITATAALAAPSPPDRIRGTAEVDPHNGVIEFIETNNGPATFTVNVVP